MFTIGIYASDSGPEGVELITKVRLEEEEAFDIFQMMISNPRGYDRAFGGTRIAYLNEQRIILEAPGDAYERKSREYKTLDKITEELITTNTAQMKHPVYAVTFATNPASRYFDGMQLCAQSHLRRVGFYRHLMIDAEAARMFG